MILKKKPVAKVICKAGSLTLKLNSENCLKETEIGGLNGILLTPTA